MKRTAVRLLGLRELMSIATNAGLELIARYGGAERWLAVLVTLRRDGEPSTSVVNAGILSHPVTAGEVVAFVARGGTAKLANLRRRPRATLVFRAGWEWVAVTGPVELVGPDDHLPDLDADAVPRLLRDVFHAAGGAHDDLDTYDHIMATERRTAVLLRPERFATNPPGTEHEEH
jgi:PPOX class probable F420-dependent enzyme